MPKDVYTLEPIEFAAFEAFARTSPVYNLMQSPGIAHRREEDGWKIHCLALKQGEETVAAAMLHARLLAAGLYEYECLQGPVVDFDSPHFDAVLKHLANYVRAHSGIILRINPPILETHRDGDGQQLDDGYTGAAYRKRLNDQGYRQIPLQVADANPAWLRWYFAKDMRGIKTTDELLASVDQQTRWSINKTKRFGVSAKQASTEAEQQAIIDLHIATGERRQFNGRTRKYYEGMLRRFSDTQLFMVGAYLDIAAYQRSLDEQLAAVQSELSSLKSDHTTKPGRLKDAESRLSGYQTKRQLSAVLAKRAIDGQLLLAGAIFTHIGDELIYLLSGSDDTLREFNGPYAIQLWALEKAIAEQIPRYNFYGTKGAFMGDIEQDGVYKFKRGFGGVVEEQIGYFEYVARPAVARLIDFLRRIRR